MLSASSHGHEPNKISCASQIIINFSKKRFGSLAVPPRDEFAGRAEPQFGETNWLSEHKEVIILLSLFD